jgi:hypothetical protein
MAARSQPSPQTLRRKQITKLTDWFCDTYLNDEYLDMCRIMAKSFCIKGSPAFKGKASGWAAGIVGAIGYANFLHDPQQQPHVAKRDLAKAFGMTAAELKKYTDVLIEGFDLIPFDPDFSLPSRINLHAAIWAEAGSNCIPYEQLPSELQQEALRKLVAQEKKLLAAGDVPCCGEDSESGECCGAGTCDAETCCQAAPPASKPVAAKKPTGRPRRS